MTATSQKQWANRKDISKERSGKHLVPLMELLFSVLGSRSADLPISALHPALAPFLPEVFTFEAAKIIFACAAEQLETATLISATDQI